MNEKTTNETTFTSDFSKMSENDIAAMNLRMLMMKAEGEEKCVLCQAANLLEKRSGIWDSNIWFILIFMLCFGFGNFSNESINLEAILDTYLKMKEGLNDDSKEELNNYENN